MQHQVWYVGEIRGIIEQEQRRGHREIPPSTQKKRKERRGHHHLVEPVGDDDPEAEREPEGGVEHEERLPPSLAWVRGQPQAATGTAAALRRHLPAASSCSPEHVRKTKNQGRGERTSTGCARVPHRPSIPPSPPPLFLIRSRSREKDGGQTEEPSTQVAALLLLLWASSLPYRRRCPRDFPARAGLAGTQRK